MPGFDKIPETIVAAAITLAARRWSKASPADRVEALVDYAMLAERRMLAPMGILTLAERWWRSREFVRGIITEYEAQCQACGMTAKDSPAAKHGPRRATVSAEQNQQVTTPDRQKKDSPATVNRQSELQGSIISINADAEQSRASTPLPPSQDHGGDRQGQGPENTDTDDRPRERPKFEPPQRPPSRPLPPLPELPPKPNGDAYADPGRLSEIWEEERQRFPADLRGKPPGLSAQWDTDMLAAGPVDAEAALRALAALCRGTPTRSPRVWEWSTLCGPRARFGAAWRDALAWARSWASEPMLGRQFIKGAPNGHGGNGSSGEGAPPAAPPPVDRPPIKDDPMVRVYDV